MAKIPEATSLGARPIPSPNRSVVRVDTSQSAESAFRVGKITEKTGEIISQAFAEIQDRRDRLEFQKARSAFIVKKSELDNSFDEDNDYTTFGTRYREAISEAKEEFAGGIRNKDLRGQFSAEADILTGNGLIGVTKLARKREVDVERASFNERAEERRRALVLAQDQVTRNTLLSDHKSDVEISLQNGYLTQVEAEKINREFAQGTVADSIEVMPPNKQVEVLRNGLSYNKDGVPVIKKTGTSVDILDPVTRISMLNDAIKASVSEAEKFDAAQNKAMKEAQDRLEDILRVSISEDPDSVPESNLNTLLLDRNLRRENVDRLMAFKKNKDTIDNDFPTLIDLQDLVNNADPSAKTAISNAVSKGRIKNETGFSLYKQWQTNADNGGVLARADVKRAKDFVWTILFGAESLTDRFLMPEADRERAVLANRDFTNLVLKEFSENPESFNPDRIADEVVSAFRIKPRELSTLPRPRFLVGTRDVPDIESTRKATAQALNDGVIDKEIAAMEARNLMEIEKILRRNATADKAEKDAERAKQLIQGN